MLKTDLYSTIKSEDSEALDSGTLVMDYRCNG